MSTSGRVQSGIQHLSGMDAGFLYMEGPTLHMHTLKVAILRPDAGRRPVTFEEFARTFERKIEYLPSFRQRVRKPPLPLLHPIWIRDVEFDLARHLALRTAAAPGGMRELNAIVSDVAGRPLLRDRPLWEITMVDGLAGDRVAFVCKLHHAMADGTAALAMLYEVVARHPDDEGAAGAGRGVVPAAIRAEAPIPTESELRRWAIGRVLRRAFDLPRLLLRTLRGVYNGVMRALQGRRRPLPAPFTGPRTSFSGALTARRSFGTTELPLAPMKQAAKTLGVKLNDVMLTVCGGALRAHLAELEGGIPSRSLIASVPINTRPGAVDRTRGNHVAHLSVSLCTDVADPVERARAIHAITDEAKARYTAFGSDLFESWAEYVPPEPYTALIRYWSAHHLADRVPAAVNLIVSNVSGPGRPLAIGHHRLEALYSVGPILEGMGLNFTGWSYGDRVHLAGLACPDQIPDVQALVDRLPIALEELVDACPPAPTSEATTRRATTATAEDAATA